LPTAGLTFVSTKVSKTICGTELGIHASNNCATAIPENINSPSLSHATPINNQTIFSVKSIKNFSYFIANKSLNIDTTRNPLLTDFSYDNDKQKPIIGHASC
jgi:hypothetical protein